MSDDPRYLGPREVVLALGSNLGDRLGYLEAGLEGLSKQVDVRSVSDVYESDAVGAGSGPPYLNCVLVGETRLPPEELLELALAVERANGRERRGDRDDRTLDVDVVFYGPLESSDPELTLPHPRWRERAFVVGPLADLVPALVAPGTSEPMSAVWNAMGQARASIERFAPAPVRDHSSPRESR